MSILGDNSWERSGIRSRLMAKVSAADEDGHEMWTGAVSRSGYGNFRVGRGKYATPQRVAWELEVGPLGQQDRLTKTYNCSRLLCVAPGHWIKEDRLRA